MSPLTLGQLRAIHAIVSVAHPGHHLLDRIEGAIVEARESEPLKPEEVDHGLVSGR